MRILHTADWHLGRALEGRSRQEEHERFVDELCEIVRAEAIDVVLIAGDIFDAFTPPAAAEELYCDALARLGEGGRRAVVVIAGNHDSPERLCAVRPLAHRHGVLLFGYPHDATGLEPIAAGRVRVVAGGVGWVEVAIDGVGHTAFVSALPYPSEARLNEVLAQTLEPEQLQAAYSSRVGALFQSLSGHGRSDAVRIAMSHIFVAGGLESGSERPIQVGGAYTVMPADLPAAVQYTALGHLHRPQAVQEAPATARYAGSPLAFDFSEAGQAKSVTVLELLPGTAVAEPRQIPLAAGRPLVRWTATGGLAQAERWVSEGRDPRAWIDLEVHVEQGLTMDEIQALRRLHPGIIYIRPVLAVAAESAAAREERAHLSMAEQFDRFYRQRNAGASPPEALVRLFLELATVTDEQEAEA